MESEIDFSIVVPVYKVEKYLRKCIDSILNQTYKNFEIILVDDGSPDLCGPICDEYEKKDSRIKVIHKQNGGLLSAWLAGLEIASGRYVGSIDSDDYVEINLLSKIKDKSRRYDCDIFVYGYKRVDDSGKVTFIYKIPLREGFYSRNESAQHIFPGLINGGTFENRSNLYLSRVNKFVKRSLLLKNKKFYECDIEYGEDNLWTIPNVITAEGIYVMSDYYPYLYRYNPDSITHSVIKELWHKFKKLDTFIIDSLIALNCENMINQVYCDSVFHAAVSINNIVEYDSKWKDKKEQIKEIINDEYVKNGLKLMNKKRCSRKERLNMFLIQHKLSCTILIVKRVQKKFGHIIRKYSGE